MAEFNPKEVDIETSKEARMGCCKLIDSIHKSSVAVIDQYSNKLNSSTNLKIILQHFLIILEYTKDISELQKANRNNSIFDIARNLLDCYSRAQKLIQLYDKDEFDDYLRNLIVVDMEQDLKIYNSLVEDTTIADATQKNSEANTFIIRFNNHINTYFPDTKAEIAENKKVEDTIKVVKSLISRYNKNYPENKQTPKRIEDALQHNRLLNEYEGSKVVYRILCHYTHSTLSSVEDRTLSGHYIVPNNADKNLLPCIELSYLCMKDCFDEFMKILSH